MYVVTNKKGMGVAVDLNIKYGIRKVASSRSNHSSGLRYVLNRVIQNHSDSVTCGTRSLLYDKTTPKR